MSHTKKIPLTQYNMIVGDANNVGASQTPTQVTTLLWNTLSYSLANNQSTPAQVIGLSLNGAVNRGAKIKYTIYRTTSTNELAEFGEILAIYKTTANTWEFSQNFVGTSGVVLTLAASGQFSYTSTNVSGTSYAGTMKWTIEYIAV